MKNLFNYKSIFKILSKGRVGLLVSAFLAGISTQAIAAPTGGTVTSGSATISQRGSLTNINQTTQKATINWQNFSIAANETVNFNQPNVSSITLNRVVGNERSIIDGALNANGQVWILNSNGILFNSTARINTAGILATTKDITDADFNSGNYKFKGDSSASVINLGTIEASDSGYVAMLANTVQNDGTIKAYRGTVHLTGASEATINLNGNSIVSLTVDKGVLDALVENKNIIQADGGKIYLTTNAVDEILKGVVNNTGIIEAKSLDDVSSEVILFAHGGTANIGGSIIADGGFVETSGDKVKIDDEFKVKAKEWLIDPVDFTIAASGGDITGATLSSNLTSTDVTIQSSDGGTGTNGDIFVNTTVSWDSDKDLTLSAYRNIYILDDITATNSNAKVNLYYGQGAAPSGNTATYSFGLTSSGFSGAINLQAGQNFNTKLGSNGAITPWTVITELGIESDKSVAPSVMTLQGLSNNSTHTGKYVLGANIDASTASSWNSGGGFYRIGGDASDLQKFRGSFDGLGHTVNNLYMNKSDGVESLFGYVLDATIRNVGVTNVNIRGNVGAAGLISFLRGNSNISNVFSSGQVYGSGHSGGLIGSGYTNSIISNSFSTANVSGGVSLGGFIGSNEGATTTVITNSYATGNVNGNGGAAEGFIGLGGYISNCYATGSVSGSFAGGFVGSGLGTISNSYSTGDVTGGISGGFAAEAYRNLTISNSYSTSKLINAGGSTLTIGGFIGRVFNSSYSATINNSFWDTSTSNVSNVSNGIGTGSTLVDGSTLLGKTTAEMKTLATFSNSGWSISGSDGSYPTFAASGSNIWTIEGPSIISLNYVLSNISSGYAYTGNALNLSSLWSASSIFGSSYSSWESGTDYNFMYGGNAITSFTNAGTYSGITVSILKSGFTEAGGGNSNGTLTINKAPLTLNVTGVTTTYDGTAKTLSSYTTSGLVNSEDSSVLDSVAITATRTNAGTTTSSTVASDNNYAITVNEADLVINKANLTVTANSDLTKVYNGTAQSVSGFSATGLVNNETISVLSGVSGAIASGTNAGTYNTALSGSDENYNLTFVDGTLTINKAPLTLNVTGVTTTYDGTAKTLSSYTTSGLVNSEDSSVLDSVAITAVKRTAKMGS